MAVLHSGCSIESGDVGDADSRQTAARRLYITSPRRSRAMVLAAVLIALPSAMAFAAQSTPPNLTCSFAQLTNTASDRGHQVNLFPSINANGTRIAFEGDGELFLADTATGRVTQLTELTTGIEPFIVGETSIDASGTRVAFWAADHHQQLFLRDLNTGGLTQLTHNSSDGSSVFNPRINAAGTLVAFLSDADLTGHNADRDNEIFIADVAGNVTQLTDVGLVTRISINSAGTLVAFNSDADFTGMNPDRNEEIFLVNTTTGAFTQLTDTTGRNNYAPVLDGTGSSVVFLSGGPTFEFMRLDIATGSITQLTHLSLTSVGEYSISASGAVLVFQVSVDLTGGNPDENWEFFLMDVPTGRISQLTDTPPDFATLHASIDSAGTHIAFISDADLAGGNSDSGSELFMATCGGVDTSAPVISGMPANCTLWPPNGKLVEVATVTAVDAQSGIAPGSFIVSASSNEPSGPGEPDIVITSDAAGASVVRLRAKRLGRSTGRVYTLTATARDLAGNRGTTMATCVVPHDRHN